MKKIMFSDKFQLTQAVLEGRKTMTRRIVRYPEVVEINGHKYLQTEKRPYKVGEVVAVAQSYHDAGYYPMGTKDEPGWRNKMFARADIMPHQIRITSIKAERLQDISDQDCLMEGIEEFVLRKGDGTRRTKYSFKNSPDNYLYPREAFAALIDKIFGKGTWESNPWVFVYEFELVK